MYEWLLLGLEAMNLYINKEVIQFLDRSGKYNLDKTDINLIMQYNNYIFTTAPIDGISYFEEPFQNTDQIPAIVLDHNNNVIVGNEYFNIALYNNLKSLKVFSPDIYLN